MWNNVEKASLVKVKILNILTVEQSCAFGGNTDDHRKNTIPMVKHGGGSIKFIFISRNQKTGQVWR